jgi:hypothetical protein
MKSPRSLAISFAIVAAACVLAAPATAGDQGLGARKIEPGVWIAKVVEVPGQWSYVVTSDPSGRRGAAYGTVDVGLYTAGLDDLADRTSPLLIDLVVTKPGVIRFNSVWYGLKKVSDGVTTAQIVYIGMNHGEITYVGRDKAEGVHNIEYFLPTQDADDDGLPDPGQLPIGGATVHTKETRLGQYVAP